ncbi:hypothetical protein ABMD26_000734 [Pseudomonas sp. PvP001]
MGQRRGTLDRALGHVQIALQIIDTPLLEAHVHQLQASGQARQQVVEVVGDAAGQLAHGLHLLRLMQRRLGLFPFGDGDAHALFEGLVQLHDGSLGLLACRDVDGRADQADDFAVLVHERRLERQPGRRRAVGKADFFFHFLGVAAFHDAPVGLHDHPGLDLVFQKLQVGAADVLLGRFADEFAGAAVGHQHPPLAILGVDHTRHGGGEGAQQVGHAIAFGLGGAALLNVQQDTGKALGPAGCVEFHMAVGFDPAIAAIALQHSILAAVMTAVAERLEHGRLDPGPILRVNAGHGLFQRQALCADLGGQAEGAGEAVVSTEVVGCDIPHPGAHDRPGVEGQLQALGRIGSVRLVRRAGIARVFGRLGRHIGSQRNAGCADGDLDVGVIQA